MHTNKGEKKREKQGERDTASRQYIITEHQRQRQATGKETVGKTTDTRSSSNREGGKERAGAIWVGQLLIHGSIDSGNRAVSEEKQ